MGMSSTRAAPAPLRGVEEEDDVVCVPKGIKLGVTTTASGADSSVSAIANAPVSVVGAETVTLRMAGASSKRLARRCC